MTTKTNKYKLMHYWRKISNDVLFFDIMLGMFNEVGRFYHNENHIVSLFKVLEELDLSLFHEDYMELYYAIFFHDFIYNPKAKDNEEKSNESWIVFAKASHINAEIRENVSKMILATKKHQKTNRFITDLFLDLDLSILATKKEDFDNYEKAIRNEYSFVPDEIYLVERARIMKSLDQPYFTDLMEAKLGKKRKINLANY